MTRVTLMLVIGLQCGLLGWQACMEQTGFIGERQYRDTVMWMARPLPQYSSDSAAAEWLASGWTDCPAAIAPCPGRTT